MAVAVLGLLIVTQAGATSGLAAVVIGFALINLGSGPMVVLSVDLVIGSAPLQQAGAPAGVSSGPEPPYWLSQVIGRSLDSPRCLPVWDYPRHSCREPANDNI